MYVTQIGVTMARRKAPGGQNDDIDVPVNMKNNIYITWCECHVRPLC